MNALRSALAAAVAKSAPPPTNAATDAALRDDEAEVARLSEVVAALADATANAEAQVQKAQRAAATVTAPAGDSEHTLDLGAVATEMASEARNLTQQHAVMAVQLENARLKLAEGKRRVEASSAACCDQTKQETGDVIKIGDLDIDEKGVCSKKAWRPPQISFKVLDDGHGVTDEHLAAATKASMDARMAIETRLNTSSVFYGTSGPAMADCCLDFCKMTTRHAAETSARVKANGEDVSVLFGHKDMATSKEARINSMVAAVSEDLKCELKSCCERYCPGAALGLGA